MPVEDDPRLGTVLGGRYRLIEAIAEGGMGVVYRGERVKLGRPVAIKFLHSWIAGEEKARKRFEIEARAMARLQHPACASVIDFGVDEGAPYVVMDYIEGITLRDLLDEGPLDAGRAVAITRQILAGLAHAHAQGIVHRDVKPANVVVGEATGIGDQVRILDFGLAKIREGAPRLTAGIAIGTPSYMAPEQTLSEPVDARTDVYAVGILLYEMLTGEKPFTADSPGEVLLMHRDSPRPRAAWTAPDRGISPELDEVVATAMAVEPDERFQSAGDMAGALADTAEGQGRVGTGDPGPRVGTAPTMPLESGPPSAGGGVPRDPGSSPRASSAAASGPGPTPDPTDAVSPPAPAAMPRLPWYRDPRVAWAAIGLAALVLISVVAAAAAGGDEDATPAGEPTEAVETDVPPEIEAARVLIEDGRPDAAIARLEALRERRPDLASIYYWSGRAYFEKLWFSDGLESYRKALRIDPAYRDDEGLIRSVLTGLLTTPSYPHKLARFLREDIGSPAVPFLEEAASDHPDPDRRSRARRVLEGIE